MPIPEFLSQLRSKMWPGEVWILVRKKPNEDNKYKIRINKAGYAKPFSNPEQYLSCVKNKFFPFAFKGPESIEWPKEKKLKYKMNLKKYLLARVPYAMCMRKKYKREYFTMKEWKQLEKVRVKIRI